MPHYSLGRRSLSRLEVLYLYSFLRSYVVVVVNMCCK